MVLIHLTSNPDANEEGVYVDIVAVHGLEETPKEAWTCQETGIHWLKDLLPSHALPARVLSFGYTADALSFFGRGSSDRILEHAHTLVAELEADRALENASQRPIIFVCHGLGGILVKRALAYSASRISKKVEHLYSIFISTYGILFMGTPHNGIHEASWPLMAQSTKGHLGISNDLLRAIGKDSETLQNITDQFAPLIKQFHIYYFWEMVETELGSVKGFVVHEDSAAPLIDDTERSGINGTHHQMCKFGSLESSGYRTVYAALLRYTKDSHATIDPRWQEARNFLAKQRENEASELIGFDVHNNNQPFVYDPKEVSEVRNKYFHIPHNPSNIYTGRDKVTQDVRERLLISSLNDAPRQQRRYVLYGTGGSGKTQFCLKFVQDNRDRFWGIFWVDASSVENAERAFAGLARLGGMGDTFANGMYWLTVLDMPWLLVIDNADDPKVDYSRFFPPGERGHILITSRNEDCRVHATIGFSMFTDLEQEDAITLLLKAACVGDPLDERVRKLARPIAKTLGHLPLALTQAGAPIRQGVCSLENYLDFYASHRKQILSNRPVQGTDQYRYTIYTTWEVSFRMIEKQGTEEAADAIQVLHVFAFLHFDQVPASIFERAWKDLQSVRGNRISQSRSGSLFAQFAVAPFFSLFYRSITRVGGWLLAPFATIRFFSRLYRSVASAAAIEDRPKFPDLLSQNALQWDGYRWGRALATLLSFSLIGKDPGAESYSMHPMVHFWARERLGKNEQRAWARAATTILAHSISTTGGCSDGAFRRSLLPHIDACLHNEHTPSLLCTNPDPAAVSEAGKFATIYSECGQWKEATELQVQVLEDHRRTLGPKNPHTLQAMTDLAWSYWNSSRTFKALQLQIEVMNISSETLGPEDRITLKAFDNLASTRWLCGQWAEAEELGVKAMNGMSRILGPDDLDTLTAMLNLGRTLMHRGRPKDAEKLLVGVLSGRKKQLGPEHADTLVALAQLGMTCHALGRFDEAEQILGNVVEIRKRVLGQEHAYTLWAINDLSKIYTAQGRPVEAELLLTKILNVVSRTLGNEHIGMLMTKSNLAGAYVGQSRWLDAKNTLLEVINIATRTLGPEHTDTLSTESSLARVYKKLGWVDKARALFAKVLPNLEQKYGPEHSATISVKTHLAVIYKELGEMKEAEILEAELLKRDQKTGETMTKHGKTF